MKTTKNKLKILLLNGPNLNLLGTREPNVYGYINLLNIVDDLSKLSKQLGAHLYHFQSNSENKLINQIHKSYKKINFIIINPAALTHTSIAIRDAFLSVEIPFIEIHISNIYKREKFRHYSYLSDLAIGVICGFGVDGYHFAIQKAIKYLSLNNN